MRAEAETCRQSFQTPEIFSFPNLWIILADIRTVGHQQQYFRSLARSPKYSRKFHVSVGHIETTPMQLLYRVTLTRVTLRSSSRYVTRWNTIEIKAGIIIARLQSENTRLKVMLRSVLLFEFSAVFQVRQMRWRYPCSQENWPMLKTQLPFWKLRCDELRDSGISGVRNPDSLICDSSGRNMHAMLPGAVSRTHWYNQQKSQQIAWLTYDTSDE